MHELSLAQNVIQILCEEAESHQIQHIHTIKLQVGLLRGVVPDLLKSCLGFASEGTVAEKAAVEIEEIPGRARCPRCGLEFGIDDILICCPQCEQVGGDILAGEELKVVEFEGE